jgi:sec-independent protein translocase protein TatB
MLDLGISKMAMIGAVALIVIGPEKLPRVARTVGALLCKAQRYVADVKAEVNQAMDLDEIKKMKESVEAAGREVQKGLQSTQAGLEKDWNEATESLHSLTGSTTDSGSESTSAVMPAAYRGPHKNWRLKRGSTPRWYKSRRGVRQHVQSGAARMARYRPPRAN